MTPPPSIALALEDVSVRIPLPGTPRRWVHASQALSLPVESGRVTAIVGESGCGKSVLALAIMGLLPPGTSTAGSIYFEGLDLLALPESGLRQVRGNRIGLIPQSAATHLNPVRTVGATVTESLRHYGLPAETGDVDAILDQVRLPAGTSARYPHELSGGMAQRVLVAMTLALRPAVVVADEPTSALDPETTRMVLRALRDHAERGAAVLLITHDLVAAREAADTVAVMYAGRLLEVGPAATVLNAPSHDYTQALLAALPENGLQPAAGAPSSLVDADAGVCAWHERIGEPCVPVPESGRSRGHYVACARGGKS
ncbi:ABC transporter ATP-binding protein [Saccharomonospora sp. NPDC046836]|uniref:ABC transporter ATP-binding protein n=1 Tax=Saccharomonospora sp. NPDC046836 TaxID=3156921 RepID=UPI0033F68381